MAEPKGDPRVFFSAERTLLAWIRTGLTVVGLGFVVARFGLFLRLVAHPAGAPESSPTSTVLGVLFVLLGSGGIAMAVAQFFRFYRSLPPEDRPQQYWLGASLWFATLLAMSGVALASYLLVRSAGIS